MLNIAYKILRRSLYACFIIFCLFILVNIINLLIYIRGPILSYDPIFQEKRSISFKELTSNGAYEVCLVFPGIEMERVTRIPKEKLNKILRHNVDRVDTAWTIVRYNNSLIKADLISPSLFSAQIENSLCIKNEDVDSCFAFDVSSKTFHIETKCHQGVKNGR